MSLEEKGTWISIGISLVVPAVYLAGIIGPLQNTAVGEVAYQLPMLTAIGVGIVLAIVARIVVTITSPRDADKSDERDANINRFGEYVGGFVLWAGALVALGMALAEFEHFWIANAIFATFTVTGLTTSVVKIVGYRRGFEPW